jgi:signal transduction histidine kinase/DNA-binding response OmpR family regulator
MSDKVDILVVDDLPDKLLAFQAVLEELGENLVMVTSGADALRELLKREFAVILLDVNMPDIDGIETAQLIRQHSKTAHTPIIFVTAYADEMQTARGYELGAVDYILSPIVPQILRSKVRTFVQLFRAQQRAQALARAEADRAAAEEATRRSEFISRASRELTASLDLEQSMQNFVELLVPSFADLALILVNSDGGEDVLRYHDTGLGSKFASFESLPARVQRAIGEAQSQGRSLGLRLRGEELGHWPAKLPFARVWPIMTGGRTIGVIVLGTATAAHHNADDGTLLELMSRAAIAFDNAELYRSLKREMTRSKEAEEKLQEANRRKDEFLAMLSHELRNPLAPIRGAAEVMRKIAPSDPRITWARDVVERQVAHLAQLVDDLLDVSRITQGKITLQSGPVELAKVLFHSIETARAQLEAKRQHLAVNVPPEPIWLHGDFARLAQVFGNLLHNAVKYTPDGGSVEVEVAAQQGEVAVRVSDTGIGIDRALLPHVFELFTQGDRGLDRSQGGLGVGLTVVERLVALHHGRVEVRSDGLGKGSEFRVFLPCISEVRAANDAGAAAELCRAAAAGKRVLVVDDNVDAAETIAVFLRLEGHDVKTANDGPQALACYQLFLPEVAVIDIGLPGMDGYEVARRLAQGNASPLLIALTGYGQHEDKVKSHAAGFHHHFIKPANPKEIHAVIMRPRELAADLLEAN